MGPETINFLIEEAQQCNRWADGATTQERATFFRTMALRYCARAEQIARAGYPDFLDIVMKATADCFNHSNNCPKHQG